MTNNIIKIQHRTDNENSKGATYLTIPAELAKTFEQFSHMKATINGQGNLEYKPVW